MLNPEIKSKINQLWDRFWSGGIANPLTAIEQISYLLFIKRLEETDKKKKLSLFAGSIPNKITLKRALKTDYTSDEKLEYKKYVGIKTLSKETLKWSQFSTITDKELKLEHVAKNVFPFIQTLNGQVFPFSKSMKDAVFIIPKPSLLDDAIKLIDGIYDEIKKQQAGGQVFHDTLGDIYEYLLNEIARSGKNGQFRTPRHIIRLIVELVDPTENDKICDPTSGTAGFLVGAYQHIITKLTSSKFLLAEDENGFTTGVKGDKIKNNRTWTKLHTKTFYGFDFDPTMVRLGLMNLMLHDITHPHIEQMDTLSKKYDKYEKPGTYSIILANPPFKGSIDRDDKGVMRIESNKTELLFIDRIIRMLSIGGKAGVIIPDGVLFGSSNAHQEVRKLLLQTCELKAVISMPSGVFKPYAGVSTAILVFDKRANEIKKPASDGKNWHTKKVWFYKMESDGYSLDDNRRLLGDKPLPVIIKEFKNSLNNYKLSIDRKKIHFFVPIVEIINNKYDLSLNKYKEFEYNSVEYTPPKQILSTLIEMEKEILAGMNSLNELIK
ncbi:MAG: N-6 DNA methylase [Bacteroidetes bacterium]|nr:N-6 DNA methylase [Bacteroidota bacterium]